MKAITPIIAIVLLLMITISMAGFAFLWFQRIGTAAMNATQAGVTTQQKMAGKMIAIESVDAENGLVYVRNIGTYKINASAELAVYVNGTPIDCENKWDKDEINPGEITYCNHTAIKHCKTVRVTAPGNVDELAC